MTRTRTPTGNGAPDFNPDPNLNLNLTPRFGEAVVPLADSVQEFVYYWAFAAWVATTLSSSRPHPWPPLHILSQVLGAVMWLW